MIPRIARLVILFSVILAATACEEDGCNPPTIPGQVAHFDVYIRNLGQKKFWTSTNSGLKEVLPGVTIFAGNFSGPNGKGFGFNFYDEFGSSLIAGGTCILNNAEKPLLFAREVDWDPGHPDTIHCILWGND